MRGKMYSEKKFDDYTIKTVGIVGPITTKSYFGGVATFDENLAIAFKNIGYNVILFSSLPDIQEESFHEIPVRKINFINVRKYKVDLVICSLGDVKFLSKIDAKFKIAFLHGFFSIRFYGLLKAMAGIAYQKFFFRYADAVIANSSFTRFMNREAAGISTDGSVHLGVSCDFLNQLKKVDNIETEPKSILFTGRLVNVKRVDRILNAIRLLKENGDYYHLYIVGDGPEKDSLQRYNDMFDLHATFVGKVDQKTIVNYYKKNEIFISLNESEPYGITFCEALVSGCKIICPSTGGQVEYLRQYPESVEILESDEVDEIAKAIKRLSDNKNSSTVDLQDFTYERTAKELLNIIHSR